MSFPITIEGKRYFVSPPSLADFANYKAHLQREHRAAGYAAIPAECSPERFKQFKAEIDAECDAVDPFKSFAKLAESPAGLAILFHSILRHDNPQVDLAWCDGLLTRAANGETAALEALAELRRAMDEIAAAKKNGSPTGAQATAATRRTPSRKKR